MCFFRVTNRGTWEHSGAYINSEFQLALAIFLFLFFITVTDKGAYLLGLHGNRICLFSFFSYIHDYFFITLFYSILYRL